MAAFTMVDGKLRDMVSETYDKITSDTLALHIINRLAPLSRRDEWWGTDGPVTVIEEAMRDFDHRPKITPR